MKIYEEGKSIGTHGLILIKELDPIIKPTYKERRVKCLCPICNKPFDTDLRRVVRKDTPLKKAVSKCPECSTKENNKRIAETGRKSIVNLVGKRFGKLTVLYDSGKRQNRSVVWHCRCDCTNELDVNQVDLQRGHTKSCGCVKSYGERLVQEILQKLNIKYKKEYIFNDCINPKTNQKLRFDFYLPGYNVCIEYDGEQHFKYSNTGWNTKENFEKVKYRDNLKNKYCKENNIKLIRIPYTDENKINENYILSLLQGPISQLAEEAGPNPVQ